MIYIKENAYNMHTGTTIELRKWMRFCPYILVPNLSDEEWNKVDK